MMSKTSLESIEENNMYNEGKVARKIIACTRLMRNLVDTIIFILTNDTMIITALIIKVFETQSTYSLFSQPSFAIQ